jgi:hypothetical protein
MNKNIRLKMNKDVMIKILCQLDDKDIESMSRVNKFFNLLCKSPILWRYKLKEFTFKYEDYVRLYIENPKKLYEIMKRRCPTHILKTKQFPYLFSKKEKLTYIDIDYLTSELQKLEKTIFPLFPNDRLLFEDLICYNSKFIWDGNKVIEESRDFEIF